MSKRIPSQGSHRIERIRRALRIAARVVAAYEGGEWEAAAVNIFERLERELVEAEAQDSAKARAKALINS